MYRNSNYDELLATKLNSEEFAQEYLLSLVEDPDEPMTIEEALRFAIPKMGVSEFCLKSGIRKQNVNDFFGFPGLIDSCQFHPLLAGIIYFEWNFCPCTRFLPLVDKLETNDAALFLYRSLI